MSVTLLLSAGAGYALVMGYDANIARIGDVFGADGGDRPADGPPEARTLLLVGSDSRGNAAPGEGDQGRGSEFVTGERADTIVLAHLFGQGDRAQLVSIPRDTWVEIPEFTDPATGDTVPAHSSKINSALFAGGPPLLVATVEKLSGLRVDHYVQIDFAGFITMVDRLGGIDVCLSEPARDPVVGIDLPAGEHTLEGEQALQFVRQRQGLPRGDIDRIARQQQFMAGIVRKVLSAGTLLNPFKLNGFLDAATESLSVDDSLELSEMRELAFRMRGAQAAGVAFTTVPVTDTAARREGQSVVLLDEAATAALFDRLRRDLPPGAPDPEAPAADEPLTVPPSEVRIRVLNGAGVRGLGARASSDLEAAGFVVAEPPANRSGGATRTVVRHGPATEQEARTVAAALPGATLQRDPALGATVEVVVGSSYAGVTEVTVGEVPTPPPPAPAGPEPDAEPGAESVVTAGDDRCTR